jgi:dTDP-4-amino-4,6-dideoxygalactose transaminase
VRAFETAIAEAVGAPHAVAFSSGTAALHAAAHVAGLGPGDELITSAITFAASANCAAYVGATPVLADIDLVTRNVSAETVAAARTERTRAVVPVHFAGLPAPVAAIREAVGDDVTIVEDAAHALGAHVDGDPVGSCTHSDMTVFSFHPVKVIAAGEGGMVTTRDPELARRLGAFRSHGMVRDPERLTRHTEGGWYMEQQELGLNYRLSDIHAALGTSQLGKLERFVAARNAVAERYAEAFAGLDAIEPAPVAPASSRHGWHLYVIRHRDGAGGRRRLFDGLRAAGIGAQVHYLPVHMHPYYRETYGYGEGLCPQAEAYYAGCVSLPCFPALASEDQARVIEAVRALA